MKKIIAVCLVLVFVFAFAGCGNVQNDNTPSNLTQPNTQNENDFIRFSIDTSVLTFDSTMENINDDIIDIYTDGTYLYYVFKETNEFFQLSLSFEAMDQLEEAYTQSSDTLISADEAEKRMLEAVKHYFPEYNNSNLKISVNETGNCLEYYIFEIAEYNGINRLNQASISVAFDGMITFVTGSHNSPNLFDGSDVYSDKEILEIVFNYVLHERESIAKNIYSKDEHYNENGEVMPEYQLIINTQEDMKDVSLEKIVYKGKPCWQVEFTLVSSWSEIDDFLEVTNPLFHVHVDAITGEVISYIFT